MVGYELSKTVTENGSVARGICSTDENGFLTQVVERTKIEQFEDGIRYEDGDKWVDVADDTIVSMNMWGFMPSFLDEVEARFVSFLNTTLVENPLKGEYFLPTPVSQLIEEGKATVKVLTSADRWYGVTYAADKPVVMNALHEMQEQGLYPDGLWG